MSTPAIAIREAIFQRLDGWPGYRGFTRTPIGTVQPEKLPNLAVFLAGETMHPDGDANAAEPKFISDVTISVSALHQAGDQAVLEGMLDDDIDAFQQTILTDPTFHHFGGQYKAPSDQEWAVGNPVYWDRNHDPARASIVPDGNSLMGTVAWGVGNNPGYWRIRGLFEAITQMTRRHLFPAAGDLYLAEVRLEMTFQVRVSFDPVVPDDYEKTILHTRQLSADPDSPSLTTVIDAVD